jgi:type IV pilus assembly protein PilX
MRYQPKFSHRQQGAILVVSVLLLLVMTVLALTASQTTRLQERMAGNARDLDLAFQAGEAGLRDAETRIDDSVGPKGRETLRCLEQDIQACDVAERVTTEGLDFADATTDWWADNAYAVPEDLHQISLAPHYYTEQWADVRDTITTGGTQPKTGTLYYTTTSRAQGATDTAVVMIKSTYAVRYSN